MKAVFNALQIGHEPAGIIDNGVMLGYPDSIARAKALLKGVKLAGANLFAAKPVTKEFITKIHAQFYLEFLKGAYKELSEIDEGQKAVFPSLRSVTRRVKQPNHVAGKAALYLNGTACPVVADTWSVAKASADSAITAADHIVNGDTFAYALCRPPGHVAGANYASYLCYLNNAALAATKLLEKYQRISILDIGLRHGTGTQGIFWKRSDVLFVSVHINPDEFFPFLYGFGEELGEEEGAGFNFNIPLPGGAGDVFWLSAVEIALKKIDEKECQAIVLSLGLDFHHSDPANIATVSSDGLKKIAQMVAGCGKPVLIVQEEGGLSPHLPENLATFLTEFSKKY